ncbi:unnamed protein product [Effrenium voratum]|nr:unnamed protein product [Effrenium voratum]
MSLQNFMGGGKASDLAFLFSDVATDVESLNGMQLSSGTPLGVVVGSVISKIVISTALATLGITCTLLLVLGLPEKQKRHIQSGLPKGVYSFSVGVVGFVYLSTETYVPSLPQMELDLQGSQTLLSGTVQINLLMKALGCFIIAPLSDRIGRRPAMLTCLALATLTSFSCMLATHISWFFLARILQGLSEACECLVFAIIRDFCDDTEERYQVLSSIWIATIFANMSAPLIGGVIAIFSSWRFGFLLLVVSWGGLFLFAYLKLPESAPDEARSSLLQEPLRPARGTGTRIV